MFQENHVSRASQKTWRSPEKNLLELTVASCKNRSPGPSCRSHCSRYFDKSPLHILFYQGLTVGCVVSVCQLTHCFLFRRGTPVPITHRALLTFLIFYSFVITVPTNADRSFGLLLLQRIDETPTGSVAQVE